MAKDITIWADAVQAELDRIPGKMDRPTFEVLRAARDIDYLLDQQAHDMRDLSAKFAAYARYLVQGRHWDAPFGYSHLRNAEERCGRIEQAIKSFQSLAYVVLGEEGVSRIEKHVTATRVALEHGGQVQRDSTCAKGATATVPAVVAAVPAVATSVIGAVHTGQGEADGAPRPVFAVGSTLRVVAVDPYGFNGRDHHPKASDVGVQAVVRSVQVEPHDANGDVLDEGPACAARRASGQLIECDYACYTVVAPDGRTLELIDHEVELVGGAA
jgi:hypothetical protein